MDSLTGTVISLFIRHSLLLVLLRRAWQWHTPMETTVISIGPEPLLFLLNSTKHMISRRDWPTSWLTMKMMRLSINQDRFYLWWMGTQMIFTRGLLRSSEFRRAARNSCISI